MLQIAANNTTVPANNTIIKWIKLLSQNINIKEKIITIRIVEEAESQALNNQFRKQNHPTNVLSFPSELPEQIDAQYLGDIVICADVVEREAKLQNKSIEAHWAHMVVHGILHLHGYDHLEEVEAKKMEGMEVKLLALLGYANPYER